PGAAQVGLDEADVETARGEGEGEVGGRRRLALGGDRGGDGDRARPGGGADELEVRAQVPEGLDAAVVRAARDLAGHDEGGADRYCVVVDAAENGDVDERADFGLSEHVVVWLYTQHREPRAAGAA